ncbi:MAG: RiPP maturation radical SAM protein 1 [Gemmatimonadales bacterium]|nr:MAG: RiPP maturation radical SAM protein 1 [Gemmatimonadales bacterium]
MPPRKPRVAFVCMPWASAARPSLGIGILVADARRRGYECDVHYPNVRMSAIIDSAVYEAMASERSLEGLGEHLFAVDIFGPEAVDSDAFLEGFDSDGRGGVTGSLTLESDALFALRDMMVPSFLDECLEQVLASNPDVVGFTCLFSQVMPSLALARRIKKERPEVLTLLGGGSVHGAMGSSYAQAFPKIVDHVFTGEADLVFPAFLEKRGKRQSLRGLPGVTANGELQHAAIPVRVLDDLPTPDYDQYFETHAALIEAGERPSAHRDLPFESARGCWWGEKSHCTFCGLNNEGMAARNKSNERVVQELTELSGRYRATVMAAADNILTHSGYRELLPQIAELGLDLKFFYEIKANVTRDDVAVLRRAGVHWVQPGIESFSDHVLALMRKGVSAAQNIQLLKWLHEFGITPYYNLLVGFPGEENEDYEGMLQVLPSLFHLTPPSGNGGQMVQVHRFSPFFFEREALGIEGIRPKPYYRHLIPEAVADPMSYAYFFDRDEPDDLPFFSYQERIDAVLHRWSRSKRRLSATLGPGFITIRGGSRTERDIATLEREHALVFLLADAQTSMTKLRRTAEEVAHALVDKIEGAVADLVRRGFMVELGSRLVTVIPFERARSSAELREWLGRWLGVTRSPRTASASGRLVDLQGDAMTGFEGSLHPTGERRGVLAREV